MSAFRRVLTVAIHSRCLISLLLLLPLPLPLPLGSRRSYADAAVSALFVFGDSLIDPGNNKFLLAREQADFRPNGIDFPGGKATGRFCNGLTTVDFIAMDLGLSLTPAYFDPSTKGKAILGGVNYASGGARIANNSGGLIQNVQPLGKQLENFAVTRAQIVGLLGGESAALDLFARSIFIFSFGANDYINYMNSSRNSKTPQEFQDELLSAYDRYLHRAYELGARKVSVSALGALGCIPYKRQGNFLGANGKACNEELNTMALNFDKSLKQIVIRMNQELPNLNMVYATAYDLFYDASNNPSKYGFVNGNSACCGVLPLRIFACLPGASYCSNRDKYLYWDAYHPTEYANRLTADAILNGSTSVVFPFNLRHLANI